MHTVTFTDAMWNLIESAAAAEGTDPTTMVTSAVLADLMARVKRGTPATTDTGKAVA